MSHRGFQFGQAKVENGMDQMASGERLAGCICKREDTGVTIASLT